MEKYNRLATPPADATKAIEAGKLKGKTDINPQWKIEAMTRGQQHTCKADGCGGKDFMKLGHGHSEK